MSLIQYSPKFTEVVAYWHFHDFEAWMLGWILLDNQVHMIRLRHLKNQVIPLLTGKISLLSCRKYPYTGCRIKLKDTQYPMSGEINRHLIRDRYKRQNKSIVLK